MSAALVDVAVGVVMRADGCVLLGQRLSGKAYCGWWEFPGGKFEAGEDAAQALARELQEEIGIRVIESLPWVVREHVYGHAHVRLHFRRVLRWEGEPHSAEGQALAWQPASAIGVGPLLPASLAPIQWLGLPGCYALSHASGLGTAAWLARLDAWIAAAGRSGGQPFSPGMLLLREPGMDEAAFALLFEEVLARLRGTGIRLLISSRHPSAFARRAGAETGGGIHLTGADMRAVAQAAPVAAAGAAASPLPASGLARAEDWRAPYPWLAVSCHSAADLQLAGRIGADFAVCGPVSATPSHPEATGSGWAGFAAMIADTPIPVYALGGLGPASLAEALAAGAQGIAMQRAVWN